MTKTWQQIRQELSRRVNEPIMRRVGTEVTVGGSTSTINFYSAALAHLTSQWGVQYGTAYVSSTTDGLAPLGQELEIQDFLTDGSVGYAYVQPTGFYPALYTGDKVEIHEFFTAQQLLDATNQAIRDAWPAFYKMTRDETTMLRKFKREYDLTALSVKPRHVVGAFVEPIFRVGVGRGLATTPTYVTSELHGTAAGVSLQFTLNYIPVSSTAGVIIDVGTTRLYDPDHDGVLHIMGGGATSSTIVYATGVIALVDEISNPLSGIITCTYFVDVVANSIVTDLSANWALESNKSYEIAIYYGTCAGEFRTIDVANSTSTKIQVYTPFTSAPDSTSEYMVKNLSDVYYNWLGPIAKVRYDQDESPNIAEILYDTYELWGARLRFEYASVMPELTTETSTIPDDVAGYVIPRAMYYLYLQNIGRTAQFDVKTAATLADQYQKEADEFRDRNRMKRLGGTIRTDAQYMNWSDREMPFKR